MIDLPTLTVLLRGLHLAATLSLLGSAGFVVWMLPAAAGAADSLRRRLNRLAWISGLVAILAGAVWFVLQSAAIAGVEDLSELRDALPVVAMHTRFGTVLLARLGLLSVATLLARSAAAGLVRAGGSSMPCPDKGAGGPTWQGGGIRLFATLLLTAAALGLQGLIGHAGAMEGTAAEELVASESLHLIAAGIWLGALLPLGLALKALPQVDQSCLRLRAEGLSYREISRILGISLGSVSASLVRSLARLEQADRR